MTTETRGQTPHYFSSAQARSRSRASVIQIQPNHVSYITLPAYLASIVQHRAYSPRALKFDPKKKWCVRHHIAYGEVPDLVFPETVLIIVRLGP